MSPHVPPAVSVSESHFGHVLLFICRAERERYCIVGSSCGNDIPLSVPSQGHCGGRVTSRRNQCEEVPAILKEGSDEFVEGEKCEARSNKSFCQCCDKLSRVGQLVLFPSECVIEGSRKERAEMEAFELHLVGPLRVCRTHTLGGGAEEEVLVGPQLTVWVLLRILVAVSKEAAPRHSYRCLFFFFLSPGIHCVVLLCVCVLVYIQ